MKKILTFIVTFIFFVMPVKAYADSATIEIVVNGQVKKGAIIEILINVKEVNKLYAASVDFTYDTNQLRVESIAASDFITKHNNDIMELGGETAKNGNTASYSFTFLGEKYGIKGSGTLAVISAEVLNDESLSIGQDNMKVKLVQKVGDTVENYSFKFLGYNDKSNTEVSGGDNLNINNNGNSQSNSSNNSSLSTESNENNKTEIDSNKEKIEATEFNGGNSNNTEESTYENGEALESCSEEADNTKDNVNDIDGKENSEEKDLLASKGSNKGILITSEIILTLVVAGGVAGYYFYKKRNKLS
ncbi:cohesin domain-containing protein [Clostridium saudiense]|uniref:cohesin domain-containing protein n=1 Tax=Clostridium saudiense TaxID=1414720 RepID=UPI000821A405|nr:cohesin domain-containing protein [Clostridium saudiense]MDU7455900.1 cohesin domain-containing protein [Clostridium saudiense]SCK00552.1 Cohesin domain [uncultured Clostridium sp.]